MKKAQRLRFRHAAWLVATVALGGFGLVSLLVTLGVLLVVSTGIVGSAVALLAAISPLLLAGYAGQRTRTLSAELSERIAEAWRAVAEDVVAHDDTHATPEHLSRALRIDDEAAERLLTDLSVHDVIRARVTDDGDLVYYRSDAPPKWRVDSTAPPSSEGRESDADDDPTTAHSSATVAKPED